MSTLTVTTKGQVTFQKDVLAHLGVQPGDRITVEKLPDGRIEIKAVGLNGQIADVFGFLSNKTSEALSIEAIDQIAAQGWAGKR